MDLNLKGNYYIVQVQYIYTDIAIMLVFLVVLF